MLSSFRYAGILIAIFAVSGLARAQEMAPANSGVPINKMVINNGSAQTFKYYVTGGSPQLQALVRRIEYTENELSVIEQLQGLKMDTVVSERRIVLARAAQLTSPYVPPGFIPPSIGMYSGGDGRGTLQRAINNQLAYEATPQMAMQMIGYLEQLQTELDAQLKALAPKEQKAAQGVVDALRPRVAALTHSDAPALQPQPVAPAAPVAVLPKAPVAGPVAASQVKFPTQAFPQQLTMPMDPVALQGMINQQFLVVQQALMQKN